MAAAPALMKNIAGHLLWILAAQTVLVSQLANNAIALPPPPQTMAASLAHCSPSGLGHYQQTVAVLHGCMLITAFAAAMLLPGVRRRASGAKDARPPARTLRATTLLAAALSLASAVLAAATLHYVLQVRMDTVYSCLPGAAKATLWAVYALAGLACTSWLPLPPRRSRHLVPVELASILDASAE